MHKIVFIFLLLVSMTQFKPAAIAQDELAGTVYYSQIDKFEFEPTGRLELDQYAKTMPSEFTFEKVLYYDEERSLFEDSPNPSGEPLSRRDRWILHMSKYGRKPTATLKKIYSDFEKMKKTELLDFMTREFRVEEEIETPKWKMLNQSPQMIAGYTCMAAEMTKGEDIITAWFTPQIPVSTGPAGYGGLPGLIMAVEKNSYTIYVAAKVQKEVEEGMLSKPKDGKKVSREKLQKIMDEKMEEFKQNRGNRNFHGKRR